MKLRLADLLTNPPHRSRDALTHEVASRAGCLSLRHARDTGRLVGVYRAKEAGLDDVDPYATVCEDHGTLVTSTSRRGAEAAAANPASFCEDCRSAPARGRGSRTVEPSVPVEPLGSTTGVFRGPVRLFRALDRFERDVLADAFAADPDARFTGGRYSVPDERAGGAAFAASMEEALRFAAIHGDQRGRLRPPLYVVEVEGEGLPFARLDLGKVLRQGRLPLSACAVGLGCNLRPRLRDVVAAWLVVDAGAGVARPVDWLALLREHRSGTTATTLRAIDAFDFGYEQLVQRVRSREELARSSPDHAYYAQLLRETHRAMVHLRDVLPGHAGLGTFEHNVVRRSPPGFQKEWAKMEAAAARAAKRSA